jgi:fatty acid CoA ligase FadD9
MACPPNVWNDLYQLYISKTMALEAIADLFGYRIKFLITGGAPTSNEIISWIKNDLFPSCTFADSYGCTEVGAITSNGFPMIDKGVRIRIGTSNNTCLQGELYVHSPNMSVGYFNDNEATQDNFSVDPTLIDAFGKPMLWYRTGDLVSVFSNADNYVNDGWCPKIAVRGRVSAMVTLSSGEIVCPDALECVYVCSTLYSQVFVHANDNDDYVVAIVVIANAIIVRDDECISSISAEFKRLAALNHLRDVDIPKRILIDGTAWTVENGLLTGSLKNQRKNLKSYFEKELKKLHSTPL